MQEDAVGGFMKFNTSRLEVDIDGQQLSGTLGVDVAINGGLAKEKTFDVTGSSLTLNDLRAPGTQRGWDARIDLAKTIVVWSKPAKLDANGSIYMTDTRPLIDIFLDARGKGNKWLDRILDLKNVRADGTIKVEPHEVLIPYALATSDTVVLGAKGLIRKKDREGIFYAKYGPFAGILTFDGGKRRFGLINAKKKFEEYVPGGRAPLMRNTGASSEADQSKQLKRPFPKSRRMN